MKPRKLLFVDRDGTLIEEPPDEQVDSAAKVRLMPEVLPALRRLRDAGYEFVIVSNQDGLGTADFPQADFDAAHEHMRALFASQGIEFAAEFFCPHRDGEGCGCRKPATGLLTRFLTANVIDTGASAVVGDRDTDLELADNLGLPGYRVRRDGDWRESWPGIAHELCARPRRASVVRRTRETEIRLAVDLDRGGGTQIATGIGFFDHMLEQIAKHGGFTLELECSGDLEVDEHHTVEDVALALGQALGEALGDKRGIGRYGFTLPMDEARAAVALDLSGRPWLRFEGEFGRERIGALPSELVTHFFHSLATALGASLHITVSGENAHHMVESCFKGVGRALGMAIRREGDELPSTKGVL